MAHLLCASLSEPFAIDANAESALPPFLLRTRLSTESLLGATRFVPNSTEEALTATFASWNLLDAIMYQHMPDSPFQTGYLRELQLRRMIELVREPHVRTYVEVGMNGGHSLMAMLLANPRLHADVFDLFKWKYSWSAASLINATFPGRATFHEGWSHRTLPVFTREARTRGLTGDLMLVDGGHTFRAARADLEELQAIANAQTMVVTDDIGMPPGYAIKVLNRTGTLKIVERYGPFPRRSLHSPCMRAPASMPAERRKSGRMCPSWGFAVSRFGFPGRVQAAASSTTSGGSGGDASPKPSTSSGGGSLDRLSDQG